MKISLHNASIERVSKVRDAGDEIELSVVICRTRNNEVWLMGWTGKQTSM
jgi:hypothetical protein